MAAIHNDGNDDNGVTYGGSDGIMTIHDASDEDDSGNVNGADGD